MFETRLIKTIRNIVSCFGDPGSKFAFTYHCELIDEASMRIQANIQVGGKEIALNIATTACLYEAQTLLHSPRIVCHTVQYYMTQYIWQLAVSSQRYQFPSLPTHL
jgi:hypothetical protein